MKVEKMASVPLILQDPYVSIWSSFDKLTDGDTTLWCGIPQRIVGILEIDGSEYGFLGNTGHLKPAKQIELDLGATTTTVLFSQDGVLLKVEFCSPLLLEEPKLVSRPCTYLDFSVSGTTEGKQIRVTFYVTSDVVTSTGKKVVGGGYTQDAYKYAYMGNIRQTPLGNSGDNIAIDWGNCYLASSDMSTEIYYDVNTARLVASADITENKPLSLIYAFDDVSSIQYFEEVRKGYWTEFYQNIYKAIEASIEEHDELKRRCFSRDLEICQRAEAIGGAEYAFICSASYRHSIAAHKLISDSDGNMIFLSKENDSNGCIGTVDVTYPSVPLYLLYGTEYVKGMLRPIFKFIEYDVWNYDFAPHDVGRYPYATGQVYGLNMEGHVGEIDRQNGSIYPYFYQFPENAEVYGLKNQMPVEECGNMLILMAVITLMDGNTEFVAGKMDVLKQWVKYLIENGMDPGEQLCTDDFAGHLAHNVNLSVKAILGVEGYAQIQKALGAEKEYKIFHMKAKEMAAHWESKAAAGDHTRLTFDKEDSWSMKYNLVWDKFFHSELFSEEIYEKEIRYYLKMQNEFGIPLDSRCAYTKSDWILWCTSLAKDKETKEKMIRPVAYYLKNTVSRKPFSDWYDTITGKYYAFIARSVQGGIYMPMFMEKYKR